jgi:hypothetical protein
MAPDRPQYDRPAAWVIAQQHSPGSLVAQQLHSFINNNNNNNNNNELVKSSPTS